MGRNPTLSPSRISSYLACPLLYRWTYADHRGKWYLRAKSYYSFGTTLHKVLERFHDAGDIGVQTTEQVIAAYDESWLDAGFSDAEEMAEAYGEGRQILERHVEEQNRRTVTANTIAVEKLFKFEYEHFQLVGRIDRLDQHDDGTLEIIDYKSGRERVTEQDVASDIAMGCYQLLVAKQFAGQPVKATILALKSGMQASHSFSAGELEEFERDLVLLCDEIATTDDLYDRVPVYKPFCKDCDFLLLCRKHPEFDDPELAASQTGNYE